MIPYPELRFIRDQPVLLAFGYDGKTYWMYGRYIRFDKEFFKHVATGGPLSSKIAVLYKGNEHLLNKPYRWEDYKDALMRAGFSEYKCQVIFNRLNR